MNSSAPPPCPEKQLLLLCARTRLDAGICGQIRELLLGPLDWSYFLEQADENSITPLVERNILREHREKIPAQVAQELESAARANTVRCLYLSAELKKIVGACANAGIQALSYKGPVLAAQAYGDVSLRNFDDLDIVVRHRDLPKANELLLGLGYKPRFPWILASNARASLIPGEYNYRDDERRVMVEVHTELTLRHFPVRPDFDALFGRSVRVDVAGQGIETFCVEDGITILCVHGAKDFWARLSWIADISEMIQSHSELDWEEVLRAADSYRAQRMLSLGLALASDFLGLRLPEAIFEIVREDRIVRELARDCKARFLSREPRILDTAHRQRFRRQMVEGTLAGWAYLARLAVVPAEEDWQMVRLPSFLSPLYVALRPLRLFRKFGVSSGR